MSAGQSRTAAGAANTAFLAREFVTGQWYRLDSTNGQVRLSSSSFFNWDPQPEGLTALELTSADECVPVGRVSNVGTGTGHTFNDRCPLYLFGARHYHSYIKGSEDTEESGDRTPLAFMFAYTKDCKTFGRLNGEGDDGQALTLDDGTRPTISLLFQFKDGLFAKFWADYDEILRHGNRSVELSCRINKLELYRYNLLEIFTFKGIRCLIDSMTYSLPAGREVTVDMKLRTMQTQGDYNITEEQNIPDFAAAARHLEWRLKSETYGDALDTVYTQSAAASKFIDESGYQEHGEVGDYWYVGVNGVVCTGLTRGSLTWQNDPSLPEPSAAGATNLRTYKAILGYDIYEIHNMATGPEEEDWELDETPIGHTVVYVDYSVTLVAVWVNDK